MSERWGPATGRTVGKRLLDVAAVTAASVAQIPTAEVAIDGTGETTVTFDEAIVIRGVISASAGTGATADADCFVISSVAIDEDVAR